MIKKITFVIPVFSDESEIETTLNSIPWSPEIQVLLYSDYAEKTLNLVERVRTNLLKYHTPEALSIIVSDLPGSDQIKKAEGIGVCDSQFISFLQPGSEINGLDLQELGKLSNSALLFGDLNGSSIFRKTKETGVLPKTLEGIIFNEEWLKLDFQNWISLMEKSDLAFLIKILDKTSFPETFFQSYPKIIQVDQYDSSILDLGEETGVIQSCLTTWGDVGTTVHWKTEMRRYVWGLIQRCSWNICQSASSGKKKHEYSRFLNPDNIVSFLN